MKNCLCFFHTLFCGLQKGFFFVGQAFFDNVIEERMKPTFYRRNAEIEAYNDIARKVMAEEGIEVNDLYTVAREMSDDWHSEDGTHYTEDGYKLLAQKVTEAIRAHL